MKYTIIIGLILVLLWVLYSLNVQYGWVELQLGWTKVAIAVAAAGGPLKYLKQKMDEKTLAKEETETKFKFRTLERDEFNQRQKNNRRKPSNKEDEKQTSGNNQINDFTINEPTMG